MNDIQKEKRYTRIFEQLEKLLQKSDNQIARMATIVAVLHNKFDYFFWTGFYVLQNGKLTVSTYQGSLACMVLEKNCGVCWSAINNKKSIILDDVHTFEGHIACDNRSKSEIVIPFYNRNNEIIGVLDVDSKKKNSFSNTDAIWLEKILFFLNNDL